MHLGSRELREPHCRLLPKQAKFLPCQGLGQAELENKDLIMKKTKAEITPVFRLWSEMGPESNSLHTLSTALYSSLVPWLTPHQRRRTAAPCQLEV